MAFTQQPLNQEDFYMKIVEDLGRTTANENTTNLGRYVIFECPECLSHFKARVGGAMAKKQRSCGVCANANKRMTTHPLYPIWNGIRQRCYNPLRKDYHKYGGKGVTMADIWKDDPAAFISFCENNGWSADKVIDKDIKSRELGISPAIYSPETLSFISHQENAEEANGKAVLQYDLDGNFIQEYPSTVKAALSLGKATQAKSSIANCCRGLTKTSFGFIWKYK
jgi:hypothetical protein